MIGLSCAYAWGGGSGESSAPPGWEVTGPDHPWGTCGGETNTAAARSGSVGRSGGISASPSCNLAVNVVASAMETRHDITDDTAPASRQPSEPTDLTPLNGETYYILNQLSGLQADLNNN